MNKLVLQIILIIAIGILAYSNSIHVPFYFDDYRNIVHNPGTKDLQSLLQIDVLRNTRFVGFLTFAFNYWLNGLDVTGYHITNLIIHIINAFLVYIIVVLTFQTPVLRLFTPKYPDLQSVIALSSSLLFVSHPIQTQAVTYIAQRFASLATLFYLLSLVLYIKWRLLSGKTSSKTTFFLYVFSLISAIFAMKTKEIAFTLPIIITLYEFFFFGGKTKRRLLILIPFLCTMLIIPLSLIGIDRPIGEVIGDVSEATRVQTEISRWDYLLTQFRVITTYIRLIFIPIRQNLDYDYPVFRSFFDPDVLLSFLFLALLLSVAVYLYYRSRSNNPALRYISFGIFWFFISLLVESSFIPIQDVIFEHRLYLPSVGIFITFSIFLFLVADKYSKRWLWTKKAMITGVSVIVLVLVITTYARNSIWNDKVIFWEDVLSKNTNKARVHYNLGIVYQEEGSIDKAIEHYKIAIRINPGHVKARINLGKTYRQNGLLDEAIEQYQIAIESNPDDIGTHINLGIAYKSRGFVDKAIEEYQKVLGLDPDNVKAHFNLGNAYRDKGLIDRSIEHYQIAIRLNPDYVEAHNNLGIAYQDKGSLYKAIEQYQTVIKLKPNHGGAYFNLGLAYDSIGMRKNAMEQFRTAIKLNPELISMIPSHLKNLLN